MIFRLYYRLPLVRGIYLQLKQLGVHKKCYILHYISYKYLLSVEQTM
jgi:hypothetical protein